MTKKRKKNPKLLLLAGLAALFIGLVVIYFSGGGGEKIRHETEPSPGGAPPARGETPETRTITLFFLSERDDLLHAEKRDVPAGRSVAEDIETSVGELLKGPSGDLISPFPPDTRIRQVFLDEDGTAYVDFSREFAENAAFGASSEMAAVYAVVNTVAANQKAVRRVALLIEGAERETLGGHIDLSRPLLPQYSLVAR
jgi:spore germination protein GerM